MKNKIGQRWRYVEPLPLGKYDFTIEIIDSEDLGIVVDIKRKHPDGTMKIGDRFPLGKLDEYRTSWSWEYLEGQDKPQG